MNKSTWYALTLKYQRVYQQQRFNEVPVTINSLRQIDKLTTRQAYNNDTFPQEFLTGANFDATGSHECQHRRPYLLLVASQMT